MDRRQKAALNRDRAERLNREWGVGAKQARYSDDGHWYALVDRFPAALFDANGYVKFATEAEYRNSKYLRLGKQISVPRPGILAIPGYVRLPQDASTSPTAPPATVPALAALLNETASNFAIGRLQQLRAQLRSRDRLSSPTIFDRRTIHDGYAFHVGGRTELQFNIGVETRNGLRGFRHGVAFSLEVSHSLPSIDPLRPKIARFNDYVRSHPEDFPGFVMWHHDAAGHHPDRAVMPIPDDLVRPGVFVAVGRWVPEGRVDVRSILLDFDRLLPFFAYVEADGSAKRISALATFTPGCPDFVANTTGAVSERVTEISLRHKVLQRALFECLSKEVGRDNVAIEHELDVGVRVDAAVRGGPRMAFYELKVAPSIASCVRQAIGQLLEYAYWPSAARATELVIVGESEPDADSRAYLSLLRKRFALPIWYRQLRLDDPPTLGPRR